MRPSELPRPDPDALAASRTLLERIAAELSAHGNWISFARYMEMTLHEPGLGYYSGGSAKLGGGGDFVTAPELSALFARTLARQVAELLGPGDSLLEFGAGSGALAAALMDELDALGSGPRSYLILETSPQLRERQRARLGTRARWIARLPERFRGVMLANEVADAMPVHALAWTRAGIAERGVCADEDELAWCERPAAGEVLAAAREIEVALPPSGRYESELGLIAPAWMRSLARSLDRGAAIVIDYGFTQREYYHPQRSMGTLMCHYRHRAHGDPFYLPGLQDITAHVNFSALARAASESGLEVFGYASQAQFLVNCGITELLAKEDPADAARYAPLAAAANQMLSPAEMGELFKVLVVGKGVAGPLIGFSSGDRSHAL
ncbi:MAG TPA: SAM-dependent methyltransferase [Burkholderiales bacterium]|nr:SAM-dependent methyltransferase [Burkholderiales bacterium]